MFSKIMIPLDGSENSQKALDYGIQIAKMTGASILLLSVVDNRNFYVGDGAWPANFIASVKSAAKHLLDDAKNKVDDAGIEVSTSIVEGNPKVVISEIVPETDDADLIVMGKSGTGAINRIITGSTTEYVVRTTKVQVLVVQ